MEGILTRPADTAPAADRGSVKRPRQMVPIGSTETIRNRLGLTESTFSEALGYSVGAYSDAKREGQIVKTAALAAECLMRRQQASGETADEVFVLRVIRGAPTATRIAELRRLTLDDVEYFLVPVRS